MSDPRVPAMAAALTATCDQTHVGSHGSQAVNLLAALDASDLIVTTRDELAAALHIEDGHHSTWVDEDWQSCEDGTGHRSFTDKLAAQIRVRRG